MTQRRRYSNDFKYEAVVLARNPSTRIRQVAQELGLDPEHARPVEARSRA
ncbi:transposase [Guyparkeria sp.]